MAIVFILSLFLSFFVYKKFSKPKSRLFHSHHLVPNVEIKNIELLPCIRIPLGKKHLHIHHWIYLTLLLGTSLTIDSNLMGRLSFINGFCIGGIIQGLTYRDRFKLKD